MAVMRKQLNEESRVELKDTSKAPNVNDWNHGTQGNRIMKFFWKAADNTKTLSKMANRLFRTILSLFSSLFPSYVHSCPYSFFLFHSNFPKKRIIMRLPWGRRPMPPPPVCFAVPAARPYSRYRLPVRWGRRGQENFLFSRKFFNQHFKNNNVF